MATTTGTLPALIREGLYEAWAEAYDELAPEYPDLYTTRYTTKAYDEKSGTVGFGIAPVKNEGHSVYYEDYREAFTWRFTQVTYGRGIIVTREMIFNNQYDKAIDQARALGFSMRQTREVIGADMLNDGFTATVTFGDGVCLFSASHPNVSGGTWSNIASPAVPLNDDSLDDSYVAIVGFKTDAGLQTGISPKAIVVPAALRTQAARMLLGTERPSTANRDINARNKLELYPGGIMLNHYLTSTTAWFVLTNCPNSFMHFINWDDDFSEAEDFDTENIKSKCTGRYAFGPADPRGGWASAGA